MATVTDSAAARTMAGDSPASTPTALGRSLASVLEGLFDSVWRLLSSVRFALVLILLLTAGTLAGTLIMQAPSGLAPGSTEYNAWLLRVRPKYGAWTDLLSAAQLLSVFSSWWYRGLMGLLSVGIVVCTANRWPGMARTSFAPKIKVADRFFQLAPLAASVTSGVEAGRAAQALRGVLAAHGYRVLAVDDAGVCHLYADKHRFSPLGSIASHLSLVLILVAAMLGGVLGFSDDGFVIPEGSTRAVGFNTGLSVQAVSFVDEYYPEGPPKDYRSDLVLYRDGMEVKRQTIRVNDPMDYEGIRFYQSFFGPAVDLEVKDAAGNLVLQDGVGLAWKTQGERPAGMFVLPERNLTVYVVGPASGQRDISIRAGEVRLEVYQGRSTAPLALTNLEPGQPKEVAGLRFTLLRERQFTGLRVAKDPATPLVWLACTLIILGQFAVWYFPHRRLWAMAQNEPAGSRVSLAATVRRDSVFSREFERLVVQFRQSAVSYAKEAPNV